VYVKAHLQQPLPLCLLLEPVVSPDLGSGGKPRPPIINTVYSSIQVEGLYTPLYYNKAGEAWCLISSLYARSLSSTILLSISAQASYPNALGRGYRLGIISARPHMHSLLLNSSQSHCQIGWHSNRTAASEYGLRRDYWLHCRKQIKWQPEYERLWRLSQPRRLHSIPLHTTIGKSSAYVLVALFIWQQLTVDKIMASILKALSDCLAFSPGST